VAVSHIAGSSFAYFSVMVGVFVTAFYSFRMYFLVFHGEERFGKPHDAHHAAHDDAQEEHHGLAPGQKPHETPWVVTLPLVLLAIPSVFIGYFTIRADALWQFLQGLPSSLMPKPIQ
jgi:NADH-quinone oxidoreductase subunit L